MVTIKVRSTAPAANGKHRAEPIGDLDNDAAEAQEALKPRSSLPFTRDDFLSTGSTLLNLAMSGRWYGGFLKGRYFYFMGDSDSGKSFMAMCAFAEAARNKHFDNYIFIYDNVEDGALMDLPEFFGVKAAARIKPPRKNKDGSPRYSQTAEEFFDHLDDANKAGKPYIYVLDSLDGVSTEAAIKKAMQNKNIRRRDKGKGSSDDEKVKGSYGDGKAKINSSSFPMVLHRMAQLGSILIIISQTRDNIDPMKAKFQPKAVSGGHAPKFYAHVRILSTVREKLYKKPRGAPVALKIGNLCRFDVQRTRITGRPIYADIPIHYQFGVDDMGACIRYMLEWGHWKRAKADKGIAEPKDKKEDKINDSTTIAAPEFNHKGTVGSLIKYIEGNREEKKLRMLVQQTWDSIKQQCEIERKRRYT
jgi:RecA/RadA recombinase